MITLINPFNGQRLKKKKKFYIDSDFNQFLIKKNIPRIIEIKENYEKSFALEPNHKTLSNLIFCLNFKTDYSIEKNI